MLGELPALKGAFTGPPWAVLRFLEGLPLFAVFRFSSSTRR